MQKNRHDGLMKAAHGKRVAAAKARVMGNSTVKPNNGTEAQDSWDGPELASLRGKKGK